MSIRGAEFRKCDFQIHSPRDLNWEGTRPENSLNENTSQQEIEAVRESFCEDFINKCITEGLKAISVTDHHEGIYVYEIIKTKEKMEGRQGSIDLWIFPGMELTCRDSCQAIIIFDSGLPQPLFDKARSKMGLPINCDSSNSRGIIIEPLIYNIEDLQPLLEADEELRGRFIILPHVKPGGHKTVLRQGFHIRFRDMPYVGGYMDRCYPHQLSEGDRRILDGEIPAWSSEKRGVICTSDARHADFNLIGKHATWIKLASPTAESLRQAMLAPDSRIKYEEPKMPDVMISILKVEGASYIQNGEYAFNQQMSSLIGGRGAGKSSLLEYIRFGLGYSAIDGDSINDESTATKRMRSMLNHTLSDQGKITLEIFLNGVPIKVSRSIANPKIIQLESNGQLSQNNAEDIGKIIPVQAFRQGELSDFGTEQLSARLLQLVTANAANKLKRIGDDFKTNGQHLSESLAKAVRLTVARQKKAHLKTESGLLTAQLAKIQSQLDPNIVQQSSIITDHNKFISEQSNISNIHDTVENTYHTIKESFAYLGESLTTLTSDHPELDFPELTRLYTTISSMVLNKGANGNSNLSSLQNRTTEYFENLLRIIEDVKASWEETYAEHERQYEFKKESLIGQQTLISKIEELNSKIKQVNEDLEQAIFYEKELRAADDELLELRIERRKLHDELIATVKEQIETIEEKSSNLARGELSDQWDFTEMEEAIRSVLNIPSIREKRIDEAIAIVKRDGNPLNKWDEILDEMLALVKWQEGASNQQNAPPNTPLLLDVLDNGFLEKLQATISSDRVAGALRAVIRPRVNIYQKRQDGEIEFSKASQGEQAATLLNILMNQSQGLLIVDQPEEDLDNTIINDIITTIRSTKNHRQLILATHNANIVVNGDSELVMEMYLGRNKASGAIDEYEIRDAITLTMEGGKDAFELRRKKYNF